MDWTQYQADLIKIWPEILLTSTVLMALVVDLLLRGRDTRVTGWITLLGVGFTLYFVCKDYADASGQQVFGLLVIDKFAMFFKLLLGSALFVVLLLSVCFRGLDKDGVGEYYCVLTTAVLGAFFLVSTRNLLMMFLALETMSISSYILAGFMKREKRGAEAAIKYIVYGALSAGVMLYGFSILYGYAGSVNLPDIGAVVHQHLLVGEEGGLGSEGVGVAVALMLVLAGFGYKIAAFPFHFWSPDVYEGASTPVTTFLAVISKAASFGMVLRFFDSVFIVEGDVTPIIGTLVAIVAACSMTFGNIAAMLQDNAKRLLAYSSVAHSGYLLMGVAAMLTPGDGGSDIEMGGAQSVIFYLVAYTIMTLGAFGVVLYISNRFGVESISSYNGLGWKAPIAAGTMALFLLSLTGIPPTVGFIGKWYLFVPVIDKGMLWLAVVAGINSVISLFYYFRIMKAMFLKDEETAMASPRTGAYSASLIGLLLILGILTIYFGLGFDELSRLVLEVAL